MQESSRSEENSPLRRKALKIREAAAVLGVSPITIRRLIARGLIKPSRVLRHVLIPVSEIHRLLNS